MFEVFVGTFVRTRSAQDFGAALTGGENGFGVCSAVAISSWSILVSAATTCAFSVFSSFFGSSACFTASGGTLTVCCLDDRGREGI